MVYEECVQITEIWMTGAFSDKNNLDVTCSETQILVAK